MRSNSSWEVSDLEMWDDKICQVADNYDLDWFPIRYEICDYYEMIGHMSYGGMPSHYHHWSYGKTFERIHQFYNLGLEGLPYELIINSDPSIAYLMRENPLFLQVLIMAHCVGHSDFFKNNRIFENTHPESIVSRFRNARDRVKGYIEDPSIGIEKVEDFFDAVHTIKYQTERYGRKRDSHEEIKDRKIEEINSSREKGERSKDIDLKKVPLDDDYDLLGFLIEHGSHFEDWQQDILEIIRSESQYFIPQIRTKVLNEGWASFWHYKLMHELDLPQSLHIPFLKTHNQVIRPHIGRVNPYHLGFHIFNKINDEKGLDECFLIRETHDDESAIRCYIEREDCEELNLFSFSKRKGKTVVDDVSDEMGWKMVKEQLIRNTGVSGIPSVFVKDLGSDGTLTIQHDHDGRDLELDYADKVVESISRIWPRKIKFLTVIEEEIWEI